MLNIQVNASENYYVNQNEISFSSEQYSNFIALGFSEEDIDNMNQELFDSYRYMDYIQEEQSVIKYYRETTYNNFLREQTIVEEITENEYKNEIPNQIVYARQTSTHETTYKKLTVTSNSISTTVPNKRAIVASLTWKQLPSVRSYDIFAGRVTNGEIVLNSYNGSMTSTQTKFDENCGINGTKNYVTTMVGNAWNISNATIGHIGVGFTGELKTTNAFCQNDFGLWPSTATGFSSKLSFKSVKGATVYISYQHASTSVSYSSVRNAYTYSNSGLGNVIYFSNNTLRNSYDGMSGISMTLS